MHKSITNLIEIKREINLKDENFGVVGDNQIFCFFTEVGRLGLIDNSSSIENYIRNFFFIIIIITTS